MSCTTVHILPLSHEVIDSERILKQFMLQFHQSFPVTVNISSGCYFRVKRYLINLTLRKITDIDLGIG